VKKMKPKHIKLTAILLLLAAIALPTTTAYAITGNYHPDSTHPFVSVVVFYTIDEGGNKLPVSLSSGILLAPTVVLTAAHACVTESAIVCFDEGPILWSIQDGELHVEGVTSTYEGIAYQNPEYRIIMAGKKGLPEFIHRDLALIILKEPVPSSVVNTYGQLPPAGFVDTLPKKTDVTLVGYGFQNPREPGLIMRNCALARTVSGDFAWSDEFLRCSANPGQGKGGMSFGDSGGPVLLGQTNIVLAVNSYGANPNLAGVTYHTRIDSTEILDWIAEVSLLG
jgi:hypothetical protein